MAPALSVRVIVFLAAIGILGYAQAPEGPRILRPLDRTVLKPGPLAIIARGAGELRLDGKPLATAQPAPEVVTATITPGPGLHELALGDRKLQFFVGATKAPSGWKAYRPHPPAATCETCHAVKDGAWGFQAVPLSTNCFGCHDQKSFPVGHAHNAEVLAECQLCHDPHGSTEKFHLKMPRETACKQCHG